MRKKVIAVICLMTVIFQVFSATTFAAEEIDGELTIDTPFVPVYLRGHTSSFCRIMREHSMISMVLFMSMSRIPKQHPTI